MKINVDRKRLWLGAGTAATALAVVGSLALTGGNSAVAESSPPDPARCAQPSQSPKAKSDRSGRQGRPHTIVSTTEAPAAIGPYSQAVKAGDTLYVSGTLPIDPETNTLLSTGTIEEQTALVLSNLDAILRAGGMTKCNVVSTTVYLQDLSEFERFNKTYAEYFGTTGAPARATVQVARIPRDVKVEIGLIAVQ